MSRYRETEFDIWIGNRDMIYFFGGWFIAVLGAIKTWNTPITASCVFIMLVLGIPILCLTIDYIFFRIHKILESGRS